MGSEWSHGVQHEAEGSLVLSGSWSTLVDFCLQDWQLLGWYVLCPSIPHNCFSLLLVTFVDVTFWYLEAAKTCSLSLVFYSFTFFSLLVDGGWSSWGTWSGCSVTCGGGSQTRVRTCSNPPPSGGGENCRGSSSELRSCNTQGCSGEKVRENSFKSNLTKYTRHTTFSGLLADSKSD